MATRREQLCAEAIMDQDAAKAEAVTFSTAIQPPCKHHTTSIEPSKDKSFCLVKVAGEQDATLPEKPGPLQPLLL